MARLNIEDKWWTDARRYALAERFDGNLFLADGVMIHFWLEAQKFWGNGRKKIPAFVFKKMTHSQLILDCELAIEQGGLVYVRGSRQWHEWYASRLATSAKGGKSRSNRVKQTPSKPEANGVANAESPTPSPAPVPTPSPALKNKELKAAVAGAPSPSSQFIGAYVLAYRKRYGEKARPDIGGKVQGGIKRLLGGMPLERACEMIQVFLQMDDQWFLTKAHDFGTFEQNLTKVGLALDTGKSGGMAEWERTVLAEEARKNGTERLSDANSAAQKLFWGEALPTGASADSVARGDEPGGSMDDEDG